MATRFLALLASRRVREGRSVSRRAGGRRLLILRSEGRVHVIVDRCPHRGVSLAGGEIDGASIWCPGHGFRYDLVSGRRLQPPVTGGSEACLTRLPACEVDGMIGVELPGEASLDDLLCEASAEAARVPPPSRREDER